MMALKGCAGHITDGLPCCVPDKSPSAKVPSPDALFFSLSPPCAALHSKYARMCPCKEVGKHASQNARSFGEKDARSV